jgi:hypothetical protein
LREREREKKKKNIVMERWARVIVGHITKKLAIRS